VSGTISPVLSRRLARTLRRWRESAGYTVEEAAHELLCGIGTVSRMETGSSAEPLRVKAALELYGAPERIVKDMVDAAMQRRRRGVLRRPYYDFVSKYFAEYLDLENEASELSCFQSDIVHGLLQTEDYASAQIKSAPGLVEADDTEKFLRLRMERQERFRGENPVALRIIQAEAALYTEVGGRGVLAGQLRHLIELSRSAENIELRVMPFSAGAHPAVGCNFTVLAFPSDDEQPEPEVIYTENIVSFVLQDLADEVAHFARISDHLWSVALDQTASIDLIGHALAKLE
jgi:hypothetical protein